MFYEKYCCLNRRVGKQYTIILFQNLIDILSRFNFNQARNYDNENIYVIRKAKRGLSPPPKKCILKTSF